MIYEDSILPVGPTSCGVDTVFIPRKPLEELLNRYIGSAGMSLMARAGVGNETPPEGEAIPEGCIYISHLVMDALWRQVLGVLDQSTAMAFMFGLEALKSSIRS